MEQSNQMNKAAAVTPLINSPEAAHALCQGVMQTTAELISLLDRETGMLRKAKTGELEALSLQKTTLSATMAGNMNALKANAGFIAQTMPGEVAVLKEQNARFQTSLQANHDSLLALKSVSEQLIRTIAEKVSEKNAGPESYGAKGGYNSPTANRTAAISINRSA